MDTLNDNKKVLNVNISTKDKILLHTSALISQSGYAGFSYAELSKLLGINKASIHHHFPRKVDLGIAFCHQVQTKLIAEMASIEQLESNYAQLQAYIDLFKPHAETRTMCGIQAMQTDIESMPKSLKLCVRDTVECELTLLTQLILRGQQAGIFNTNVDAHQQAVSISCMIKGALLLSRTQNKDFFLSIEQYLIECV